jgi:ammonium transporter, Amt family
MTPLSAPPFSEMTSAVCVLLILLVPFASAGLALLNSGLSRSRSSAHSMMASLCAISVAAVVYWICGFAWQGYAGLPGLGAKLNWIGTGPFFLRGMEFDGSRPALAAWLGMFSAGLAAQIPLGSGGDRWRLGAICTSTALLAGCAYPIFAHWVWGGGLLSQFHFADAGGSGPIQAVGGLAALSICWIVGPRRGKYTAEGMPAAIPGHNAIYVLFGCLLALVGWVALNSAGAILFAGAEIARIPLIAINTTLAAAAAGLNAAAITRTRFGKPDASITANGWVGGLAAGSAACAFVGPAVAIVIGFIAGALVTFSVEWLELRLHVDDPGGAVSVHAIGGIWGVLAVGVFHQFPAHRITGEAAETGNFLAQLVGVAALFGFVFPLIYGLNWALDRFYRQRVAPDGERQGMDLHELGAGAYPEFVTHLEEFTQY